MELMASTQDDVSLYLYEESRRRYTPLNGLTKAQPRANRLAEYISFMLRI